jgi:hypothetical protein
MDPVKPGEKPVYREYRIGKDVYVEFLNPQPIPPKEWFYERFKAAEISKAFSPVEARGTGEPHGEECGPQRGVSEAAYGAAAGGATAQAERLPDPAPAGGGDS